jgi:CheY-like chemotaxis protein
MAIEPEPETKQTVNTGDSSTLDTHRALVLIVETDPSFRRLMKYFLNDGGYAVEFADDGYIALDRVRRSKPALLITEILLPHLDGLSLCRLLKADPATSEVPILVYTVLNSEARVRASGADGFLKKPIEKKRLLDLAGSLIPSRPAQEDA